MYFRNENKTNVLVVDDDYARLLQIRPDGSWEFEFSYSVSRAQVLKLTALNVNVSVATRSVVSKQQLAGSHVAHTDARGFINNILSQQSDAKSAFKQQEQYVVATRKSDITAYIDNNVRATSSSTKLVLKPVADIRRSGEVLPVLGRLGYVSLNDTVLSASSGQGLDALMYDMVFHMGIDPTFVVDMDNRSLTASDALGGVLRPSIGVHDEFAPSSLLLNELVVGLGASNAPVDTSEHNDASSTAVAVSVSDDVIRVPISVVIPAPKDKTQLSHTVRFDLLSVGNVIDTVTKQLNVSKHVQFFQTPKASPLVTMRRSDVASRVTLTIRQRDPIATSVAIYSRTIYKDTRVRAGYVSLGTYDAAPHVSAEFDAPLNSVVLFRVVPVGPTGILGSEFTNVVVRPSKFTPRKSVVLVTKNEDTGIRLECSSIPHDAVSIEFISRNLTNRESTFHNVGGDIIAVDEATRRADHMTVLDTSVSAGNVYEFATRIIYAQGNVEQVGQAIAEFNQPLPGKVDTVITDINVQHDTGVPNVTFTIKTTTLSNQVNTVRTLMEAQGIYELFRDDVANERTAIQDLVAHNVQRVDMTTGERSDFGTIIDGKFSDVDLGKNSAISPLSLGHRYRYDVTPQLRVPETLLTELKVTRTDPTTHKPYTFSPAKFLHPITLTQGVITTTAGLALKFAKDPMAYGTIGNVVSTDISFDDSETRIVAPAAELLDDRSVLLTWRVQGLLDSIDCFIVIKVTDDVRTLVGKTHAFSSTCQFLHTLTKRDVGEITYVIVPVFNTYKVGTVVTTNTIQVMP